MMGRVRKCKLAGSDARREFDARKRRSAWVLAVSSTGLSLLLLPASPALPQSPIKQLSADLRAVITREPMSPLNTPGTDSMQFAARLEDAYEELPAPAKEAQSENPTQIPMQVVDGYVVLGFSGAGTVEGSMAQLGLIPVAWGPAKTLSASMTRAFHPTACQVKVLNAVNKQFPDARLTLANLLPGNPQDRRLSQVNVNFIASPQQLAYLSTGRYPPRRFRLLGFLIGFGPSLHIVARPTWLDPHALAFSSTSFTAHLDSAWAYHPVGAFLHLVLDVLRPKRNPCP